MKNFFLIRSTALVIAIILLASVAARFYNKQALSGDEPHYLVIANSILHDHDTNVKNDYSEGKYLSYYPSKLDFHINGVAFPEDAKVWYSFHTPGLSALLVPAVAVSKRLGPIVEMLVIAWALLFLVYYWSRRVGASHVHSLVAVLALGGSYFYLDLVGYIFPDLLIAATLVFELWVIESKRRTWWQVALFGIVLGFMPWVHPKTALISLAAGLVFLWRILKQPLSRAEKWKQILWMAIPAVCLIVAFELFLKSRYGVWLPNHIYDGTTVNLSVSPLRTLPAIFFDANRGLFTNNQVYLLIFLGLPLWFRQNRGQFVRVLFITIPALLAFSTFNQWGAGWSPSGRYAMNFLPAFIPAIALVFQYWKVPVVRFLIWSLFLLQAVISLTFIFFKAGWTVAGDPSSLWTAWDKHFGFDPSILMPHFDAEAHIIQADQWAFVILYVLVIAILLSIGYRLSGSKS